jgi:hypothetical protein
MIMIEHFSKWVELVVLPNKSSHNTSQTFLQQVLNRFVTHPQLLEGLKEMFQVEKNEKREGVGARSLARNTRGGVLELRD